jgi:hypothetical protein
MPSRYRIGIEAIETNAMSTATLRSHLQSEPQMEAYLQRAQTRGAVRRGRRRRLSDIVSIAYGALGGQWPRPGPRNSFE